MVKKQTVRNFLKKPKVILGIVLAAFFLKELLLADLFPMFAGQDEARHYNTFQYLAEPLKTSSVPVKPAEPHDKDRLETYRFSEEIRNTARYAGLDANRENSYSLMPFNPDNYTGENENLIESRVWPARNLYYPPDVAGSDSLYHRLGSYIEKSFSGSSILTRFYLARLFSIFLGIFSLLFSYLAIKNTGFDEKASLILTAMISFQPRFSVYYSAVNYDALLILAFSVFTYAGVIILKRGANWKRLLLLFGSALLGYMDKGTGIVLIAVSVFFGTYLAWNRLNPEFKKRYQLILPAVVLLAGALILFVFREYLPLGSDGLVSSFFKYLSKTITPGRLALTSRTYWGTLSWVDSWFLDHAVNLIWMIELAAIIGLIWYLLSQKYPDYLPEKKYVLFILSMILALQLGIRLADWPNFLSTGSPQLGAPGRYFIPNLASHITLVFVGIGMLARRKEYFEKILALSFVLMFSFMTYLMLDVIVFRYYL